MTLDCGTGGDTTYPVQWTAPNGGVLGDAYTISVDSLNVGDSGTYHCTITLPTGVTVASSTVIVAGKIYWSYLYEIEPP